MLSGSGGLRAGYAGANNTARVRDGVLLVLGWRIGGGCSGVGYRRI